MLKIFTVDAFTDKMFSGNPAGVCLLQNDLDDSILQKIAAEMNLSETAFVKKLNEGFSLRWFTPVTEVELCGHATLSSAHILWQEGILNPEEEAVFHTVFKGILTAKKAGDEIELNFPANPPFQSEQNEELEKALGIKPVNLETTDHHYILELDSETIVKNVRPDFNLLNKLEKYGTIITAKAEKNDYDFVSRFFAPAKGINEDPVTGSAHCVLAPYWSKKLNKKSMKAYQTSQRGGYLNVTMEGDRVLIAGKAVTVLKGELLI
ncbi:MAG: PhzF family phenazine biosynthesis protein [Ignavibacteria bacterium]|nr:PhzF family phenazine biosynthesis protein [Ignavibacteria bacterium]